MLVIGGKEDLRPAVIESLRARAFQYFNLLDRTLQFDCMFAGMLETIWFLIRSTRVTKWLRIWSPFVYPVLSPG